MTTPRAECPYTGSLPIPGTVDKQAASGPPEKQRNMRVLITGVDQPLGAVTAAALSRRHELRLTGAGPHATFEVGGLEYRPADLRDPEQVRPLVEGIDAIAHLALHEPQATPDAAAEAEVLDVASRGTYVLLQEAVKAGVPRIVLASRLDLLAAYPAEYVVDENWQPQPEANASSLAPYLAELTVREFARAEAIVGVCLRLGGLERDPAGTSPEDATAAIEKALIMDLGDRKYRWWLYHICSTDRYRLGHAAHPPLSFTRVEAMDE